MGGVREGRLGGVQVGRVGVGGGGIQVGRFGVWGVGGTQAPLTSPCPPSNHTITINLTVTFQLARMAMPAMLIGLNTMPQILFMAAFATSLLSI